MNDQDKIVHQKHSIVGTPDPSFTPDPNEKHVWDPEKKVFRKEVEPEKMTGESDGTG